MKSKGEVGVPRHTLSIIPRLAGTTIITTWRIGAEHQRVLMESVAATCHLYAGPLTTMLSNLELVAKGENIEEPEKRKMLEQCLIAAENMKMILNKFQQVREYRTRPFLEDFKILDIGLDSIYGTPGISEDEIKHKPRPKNQ